MSDHQHNSPDEFDALIGDLLDAKLTDLQHEQLSDQLRDDTTACENFAQQMALQAMLEAELSDLLPPLEVERLGQGSGVSDQESEQQQPVGHAVRDENDAPISPRPKSLLSWASRHPKGPAIAIAATVLIAALVVLGLLPVKDWVANRGKAKPEERGPGEKGEFVAKLSNWHNDKWLDGTRPPRKDPRLKIGRRLKIESGLIEVTYLTGAKVVIEGPAEFEVLGEKSGYLRIGTLTGRVDGEDAQGFVIDTPVASIEDLGTEFTAVVTDSNRLDVSVSEGRVQVMRDGKMVAVLAANQTWRQTTDLPGHLIASAAIAPVRMPVLPEPGTRYVHWSFDKNEDGRLRESGNWFPGGPFHIPCKPETPGAPQQIDGKVGHAMSFDGKDDHLMTRFPGIGGGNPRTVACWVRVPTGVPNSVYAVVGWGTEQVPGARWQVGWNPTAKQGPLGVLRCEVNFGWILGGPDLRDGQWHHIATVLPQSTSPNIRDVQLYVDGQRVQATGVEAKPIDTGNSRGTSEPISIGRAVHGGRLVFKGDIDELFVFDRALTGSEIQELMRGETPTQIQAEATETE